MHTRAWVYIMTNYSRTTLYTGVTSDLKKRIKQHKNHIHKNSFTDRYRIELLIYCEEFSSITDAIKREKQLKEWSKKRKEELISTINPEWKDLWSEV